MSYTPLAVSGAILIRDEEQQRSQVRFRLPVDFDVTDPDDLLSDLVDSIAGGAAGQIYSVNLYLRAPVEEEFEISAYGDVEDRAVLLFTSGTGLQTVRITMPTPMVTVFEADEETVDPLDPLIAAVISAVLALVTTAAGNALTAYIRGYRSRAKIRKGIPGVPTA